MFEECIQLKGKEKGTTSIVLAGVHGDETCGIKAFEKVLDTLKIERGTVLFCYGNPRAIEANKRFIETNLNRMFCNKSVTQKEKESYEYKRAQELKKYLDTADALLDIHASSIPKSRSFIICENNAKDSTPFLPIDLVVSGFDEVEPGGTDYYMNSNGKIGICVECGYIKDPQGITIAEESIYAFIKTQGHIHNDLFPTQKSYIRIFKKYYTKTTTFVLSRSFENFEIVEVNQLIGIDGNEEIRAPKRSYILFAHNGTHRGDEVFLLGEKKESLV